jgi:putative spermidine/putrescine transport system permease protein
VADLALSAAGLKPALRREEGRRSLSGLLLLAPLTAFLLFAFVAPIAMMLLRGVQETELPGAWPDTAAAIGTWDGVDLPSDAVAATLARDLSRTRGSAQLSAVANRLNYDVAGLRGLLLTTARRLPETRDPVTLGRLSAIDPRWSERETWGAIKHAAGPATSYYLLAAVDRRLNADGQLADAPPNQAIFVKVFARTFWISALVALICVVLGYPIAYLLAHTRERTSNLLMILVLLPFWTSILVRSTAWVVLLQNHGVINDALMSLGLIGRPLDLVYNRTGVLIAMTHVLLPFFILPLYGVMKGIGSDPVRAALSLGATPVQAFVRVYAPQTLPGVAAGSLIVFILGLGYYITPALVGGAGDQMIAYFIAFYTNQSLNWGMAAALSLVLLAATLALVGVYGALVRGRDVRWR